MSLSNIKIIEEYGKEISNVRTKNYPVPFFDNLSQSIIKCKDGDTINIKKLIPESEFNLIKEDLVGRIIDLISEGVFTFFSKTEKNTILKVAGSEKKVSYPNLEVKKKTKAKKDKKTSFHISPEDITKRAEKVISSAKLNNKEGVINIFEMISLPFNGESYKRAVFEKIFELAGVKGEYIDDLGYIIFSKNRTKKTVVSHMDLIPLFNRDFKKGKVYEIKDNKLIGALDNTFTNAVVINSILNLKEGNALDDTTFLFTKDEETNQYAMRNYMKMYGNEQFIINLDVTNEGMCSNMSIEYDEPSWHICKEIYKNLDNPYFTKDRECDDLDEVLEAKGYGLSYCIPSKKLIHSYNNYTHLDKIEPYMRGLDYLIEHLCTKDKQCNIKYLSIKKSMKYNSFEKMKEKDRFKTKKSGIWKGDRSSDIENPWDEVGYNEQWTGTDDETGRQTYFDFGDGALHSETDPETCTRISTLIMDVQAIYKPENYYDFEEFIGEKLFSNESFSKGVFYLISCPDTFNVLRKINIILPYNDDEFYFNQEIINDSRFQIWEELAKRSFDALAFYNVMLKDDIFSYNDIKNVEPDLDAVKTAEAIKSLLTKGLIENKKGKFRILN